MQMTRENKLALVVGFGLILLVGVLISDHFSTARNQQSADLAANRPVDPLSKVRHSDPQLIDLQAQNQRAPSQPMRAPVAVSTAEIVPDQSQAAASEADTRSPVAATTPATAHPNQVQRVVMGQPVPDAANSKPNSSTHQPTRSQVPFVFHDVKPGETMTAIAQHYYGDATLVHALAAYNGLTDPNALRANHRLRIPKSADALRATQTRSSTQPSRTSQPPAAQQPQKPVVYTTYTVQRGDTLSELSLKLLGTSRRWRELYELNRDVISDPDNLLAGTVLKVPKP